jgi:3-oxoadipate enol-lactonase/4-carboxymuconolactone decarboxylase
VEAPAAFAAALLDFLTPEARQAEAAALQYEAGLTVRRQVLGDAWVDRALARRTAFNTEFQEMITRHAWNDIWTRPGLDHRTRRLLVIAMTAAQGCWDEFRLHVRAALAEGGVTPEEIKETLMQVAIYAGVPKANTAFHEAGAILDARSGEAP